MCLRLLLGGTPQYTDRCAPAASARGDQLREQRALKLSADKPNALCAACDLVHILFLPLPLPLLSALLILPFLSLPFIEQAPSSRCTRSVRNTPASVLRACWTPDSALFGTADC